MGILLHILFQCIHSVDIVLIRGNRSLDAVLQVDDAIISAEEYLHIDNLVDALYLLAVTVEQALLAHHVSVEVIGLRLIVFANDLEFFGCSKVQFLHLLSVATERLLHYELVVSIFRGGL